MSILKSISQFSGLTFISRLFGLVRDWLFARFFGADGMMDAFLIAFKIQIFSAVYLLRGLFHKYLYPLSSVLERTTKHKIRIAMH